MLRRLGLVKEVNGENGHSAEEAAAAASSAPTHVTAPSVDPHLNSRYFKVVYRGAVAVRSTPAEPAPEVGQVSERVDTKTCQVGSSRRVHYSWCAGAAPGTLCTSRCHTLCCCVRREVERLYLDSLIILEDGSIQPDWIRAVRSIAASQPQLQGGPCPIASADVVLRRASLFSVPDADSWYGSASTTYNMLYPARYYTRYIINSKCTLVRTRYQVSVSSVGYGSVLTCLLITCYTCQLYAQA